MQQTHPSIPGSGRSLGEGNGNLLQYFCLGNPMNKEVWQATVHGVAKESDILGCEVKRGLGSITTNKASEGDGIPAKISQPKR